MIIQKMRAIKHKDSNEKEIFEGDTIQFEKNKVYLDDDIIDFLKMSAHYTHKQK